MIAFEACTCLLELITNLTQIRNTQILETELTLKQTKLKLIPAHKPEAYNDSSFMELRSTEENIKMAGDDELEDEAHLA
jgi:hypothetical protein